MSEFDAFEVTAPTEEDPAAAFLAREQDQMAELEGEALPAETAENTENEAMAEAVVDAAADSLLDAAATAPATEQQTEAADVAEFDPTFTGDDNANDVADVADMFGGMPAADNSDSMLRTDLVDQFGSDPTSDPYADLSGSDAYAAISSQDLFVQEPEKIKLWREEQKASLETKDADAEVKRDEWREVAKRELEDWYRHREEQLEKSKKNNREAEAAFCQERDESLPGHEWERVTRLCEFNPKAARNSKDVSRMRSILLQLKQTPLVR